VVRATGGRAQIAPTKSTRTIKRTITGVDPLLAMAIVRSMTDERDSALQSERISEFARCPGIVGRPGGNLRHFG